LDVLNDANSYYSKEKYFLHLKKMKTVSLLTHFSFHLYVGCYWDFYIILNDFKLFGINITFKLI